MLQLPHKHSFVPAIHGMIPDLCMALQNVKKASSTLGNAKSKLEANFNPQYKV